MTPERWQRASGIYEAALEREPDERGAFIAHACGDDQELQREVESLLANTEAPVLIDSSVWDLADDLLPGEVGLAPGTHVGRTGSKASWAQVAWGRCIARAIPS